jgi:hypothetical protein
MNDDLLSGLTWTGTLTEVAILAEIPWRKALNWIAGRPLRIKAALKFRGHRHYTFENLTDFTLAARLFSQGISGKAVQRFLIEYRSHIARVADVNAKLTGRFLVMEGKKSVEIHYFPAAQIAEFRIAYEAALDAGSPVALISYSHILRDLLERIQCLREKKELPKRPTAGERVREALLRYREEHGLVNIESHE